MLCPLWCGGDGGGGSGGASNVGISCGSGSGDTACLCCSAGMSQLHVGSIFIPATYDCCASWHTEPVVAYALLTAIVCGRDGIS